MPRIPRIIIPNLPHHITQRGNRKKLVFFEDQDYLTYIKYLKETLEIFPISLQAFCLMPNHVHLILTPQESCFLGKAIGRLNSKYTTYINKKYDWSGHLWEARYNSVPMDEGHFYNAVKYVLLNPVL